MINAGDNRTFAFFICFLFMCSVFSFLCSSVEGIPDDKIKVITSISVLEDMVINIGGDRVQVKSLITGLETPHTFSPKPSQRIDIQSAQIFVKVGMGLESGIDRFLEDVPEDLLIIDTSVGIKGIHSHDHSGNPHIWLDPKNAIIMSQHIMEGLIKKSPKDAKYFQDNYEKYVNKICCDRDEFKSRVNLLKDKKVIAFPASFPYLLEAFSFEVVATAEDIHGQELSAKRLKEMIKIIKDEKVKVVIAEPQFSNKDAEMVAKEAGAKVIYLTPLLAPDIYPETKDYLGLMRYNLETLLKALGEGGN